MFDNVPAQAWLLIAIVAIAFEPTRYIYRYLAHAPSRRDITQPSQDLSWRTSSQLVRNVAILAALVALAVFIFTPAAAQFARSPSFWPILMVGCGTWALLTVPKGLATGQIEPFIRGNFNTYEREAKPRRFWASLTWNAAFGLLCFWLAFDIIGRADEERCYDQQTIYTPQEELSACNKLLGKRKDSGDSIVDLVAARGVVYHRLGDYRHALIDYNEAIRLQPSDADTYLNRGLIFLDTGKFDEAVADFSRAHKLRPNDAWPLANRGITYAWKEDRSRAEQDFVAVRAIDPTNPVLLRGEALLSMNAGDMQATVNNLTAALKSEPGNRWSLRMRAEAYSQLGNEEKSQADKDELWRLSKDKNGTAPAPH